MAITGLPEGLTEEKGIEGLPSGLSSIPPEIKGLPEGLSANKPGIEGLPEGLSLAPPDETELEEPGFLQKAAQLIETPARGFAGISIIGQRLQAGDTLLDAFQRGAEATKPGFEPAPGEAGVVGAAKFIGRTPLFIGATVALGAGGVAAGLSRAAISAIEFGGATAVAKTVEDFAEKGETNPTGVAFSAALGATLGFAGSRMVQAVEKFSFNLTSFGPEGEKILADLFKPGEIFKDVATAPTEGIAQATLKRNVETQVNKSISKLGIFKQELQIQAREQARQIKALSRKAGASPSTTQQSEIESARAGLNNINKQIEVVESDIQNMFGARSAIKDSPKTPSETKPPAQTVEDATISVKPIEGAPAIDSPEVRIDPVDLPKSVTSPFADLKPNDKFAININLSKVDNIDGLRQTLKKTAQDFGPEIQKQRRGVLSIAETNRLKSRVGITNDKVLEGVKPGKALNAEELLFANEALEGKTLQLIEQWQKIAGGENTTESLLRYQALKHEQFMWQKFVSGATAEAGRALNILKQVRKALDKNDPRLMSKVLDSLGGRQLTEQELGALAKIDINNPEAVYKFLRDTATPGWGDQAISFFINNIISGLITFEKNLIGNSIQAVRKLVVRPLAALIDIPVAKLAGREREFFLGETLPALHGLLSGIGEGFMKGLYTLKNGFSLQDVSKFDVKRARLPGVLEIGGRALQAVDNVFRTMAESSQKRALAMRQSIQEGLRKKFPNKAAFDDFVSSQYAKKVTDPTPSMMDSMEAFGDESVFTTAITPGSFTAGIQKLVNSEVGIGTFKLRPLRFIVPFIRVVSNLNKQGVLFSPAGVVGGVGKLIINPKDPKVSQFIAEGALGTTAMMWIWSKATTDRLTGDVPRNPAERDKFFREKKQPNSLRIGGTDDDPASGDWVSWQALEGINLGAAIITEIMDVDKDDPPFEQFIMATMGIGRNLLDRSYTQGLFNLVHAIERPEQAKRLGFTIAGGLVPLQGALRTARRIDDKFIRERLTLWDIIKDTIPGLSRTLPQRVDLLGRPIPIESGTLQPFKISSAKLKPVDAFLKNTDISISKFSNPFGRYVL